MATGELHIQLSVDFADDPKVRALCRHGKDVRAIRDLYVQMTLYCKRTMSDGFVPEEQIGLMVYPDTPKNGLRDATRLVDAGLVEVVEGGYFVPGFLKRNKSRAQIHEDAEKKAAGGHRGNHERWHVNKGVRKPDCPYCQETDPDPNHSADRSSESEGARSSDRTTDRSNDPKRSPETETETETETEIQDPSDPAPPTADADDNVLRLAANGQPAPRKGRRKQAQVTDPNAGTVVAAWVDAVEREQGERPAQRLVAQVGRQARELIEEGKDPARLIAAATAAGGKGFADLGRELLRMNGSGQRQAPRSPGATPSQYSDEDYANASFKR